MRRDMWRTLSAKCAPLVLAWFVVVVWCHFRTRHYPERSMCLSCKNNGHGLLLLCLVWVALIFFFLHSFDRCTERVLVEYTYVNWKFIANFAFLKSQWCCVAQENDDVIICDGSKQQTIWIRNVITVKYRAISSKGSAALLLSGCDTDWMPPTHPLCPCHGPLETHPTNKVTTWY